MAEDDEAGWRSARATCCACRVGRAAADHGPSRLQLLAAGAATPQVEGLKEMTAADMTDLLLEMHCPA